MFTTRSSSNRSLRRRVGIAASTAALAIGFLGASPAGAAAGDLDTQFSGDGMQTGITGTQNATASFLQLDAKLVVAGQRRRTTTARCRSPAPTSPATTTAGTLDPAYGDGGVKKLNAITGFEWVRDIAPAGTGSMLVGYGTATYPDDSDIYVVKLTSAGQPDPAFGGGDGIVKMSFSNHDRVGGVVVKGTRAFVGLSQDDGGNWANKWTVLALNTATGAHRHHLQR